jgi:predicted metal-dependent hydrolase
MYTGGSSPKEEPWDEGVDWLQDPRFLYAADLFDHRYYWEAHEQWEALWHFASPEGDTKAVLQSLIQIAAAMLQHHMGSAQGASALLGRATDRIKTTVAGEHCVFRGIDLEALIGESQACLDGGEWPLLSMENP